MAEHLLQVLLLVLLRLGSIGKLESVAATAERLVEQVRHVAGLGWLLRLLDGHGRLVLLGHELLDSLEHLRVLLIISSVSLGQNLLKQSCGIVLSRLLSRLRLCFQLSSGLSRVSILLALHLELNLLHVHVVSSASSSDPEALSI